jgi:hypothetical protein
MATPALPPQESAPLSEPARVVNTFIAPKKTFTDLRRSASWWLPFLISAIVSVAFVYVVDQKIGFRKVVENQIQTQPKQAERIERMPADQRERVMQQQVGFMKGFSYGFFLFTLLWTLIVAVLLFATLKFGLSADLKFKTMFALVMFASLPAVVKALLSMVAVLAGVASDSFTFQNPVATNPGYFLDASASPVLRALLTPIDAFSIWMLVLTAIGITCISKVKTGTAFAVVFGWYAVMILFFTGIAAAFS